jgi:hypothetical protein
MHADTFRRSLVLTVFAGASALAVAMGCSAPYKAKDGLPVCDDGDPSCNGDSNTETTRRGPSNTGPAAAPDAPSDTTTPATTPTSSTSADAGKDAAPVKQPSCIKLEACCGELKQVGYLTDTCMGVVSTNNNSACFAQHKLYNESGDCSP